ncbi:MAG: CehA/McbA family metallohydrolase [Pseudomonadota bacterium]
MEFNNLKILYALLVIAIGASCTGSSGRGADPHVSGYPKTPFTIEDSSGLIGGMLAQGKVGDVLLKNDKIRVIIQKPAKNAGLFSFGGNIIDADHVRGSDQPGNDQFGSMFPFINVEWTVNYQQFEVVSDGEDDGVKILRATGTLDVYDYLDLDFIKDAAAGAANQTLYFDRRFDDRGNPFKIEPDLKNLDTTIITEYRLEPGKNYIQIDTTFKNNGDEEIKMPVGDIVNGSGALHFLIPGIGFAPELLTQAGGDTVALIFEGQDGIDVSYGYFYDLKQFADADGQRHTTGSLTYSGVTFVLLSEGALDLLPLGARQNPKINFEIPAKSERTITRYFVVGDGSSSSVLEIGMQAMKVKIGIIEGIVATADGTPIKDAKVAVQKNGGGTIAIMRTNSQGQFQGRFPVGNSLFAQSLGDGNFNIIVEKPGYHENGTTKAGSCDPEQVELKEGQTLTVNCTLGETGVVEIVGGVLDADTNQTIAARLTIVGEDDPSPESTSRGNFEDIVIFKRGFGIRHNIYLNKKGGFWVSDQKSLNLEPGSYKFVFSHGAEYTREERDVEVQAGQKITIENVVLKRVLQTPGYIMADFHLHNATSPDSSIPTIRRVIGAAAEGMDILQSSDHDYLHDYGPQIEEMKANGYISENTLFGSIVGQEVTPNHYGHMQAFPLQQNSDSPTGGAIDWSDSEMDEVSPAPDYCMSPSDIAAATREFPGTNVVQLNHVNDNPTGLFVASGWVTSRFYLESGAPPLSSFADPVERRLLPHTGGPSFPLELGKNSLVFADFDTVELVIGYEMHKLQDYFLKSTLPTWFNLLNLGFQVTATGSSDSHEELWNEMNWPRNFVASSFDPRDGMSGSAFDPDAYSQTIIDGKVVVSGGAFVSVEANSDSGSGTLGDLVSGNQVRIKVEAKAPSWAWIDTIEVYVNTEPIPIDDETGAVMAGKAETAETFYQPYHVPLYAMEPQYVVSLQDGSLENWQEEEGLITAQAEFNLTLSEDSWIVVFVRGTPETEGFKSPYPIILNALKDPKVEPEVFDPLNLDQFHRAPENGTFAFALANPIYIDADSNGKFTAKYVQEGTSPLN